jgi:hypothetical protein
VSPECEKTAFDCFSQRGIKAARVGNVRKKSSPLLRVV